MIQFLFAHWIAIVLIFTAVLEVIASLVVIIKTPKNKRLQKLLAMSSRIPEFINQAEALIVGASEKKVFVIKRCINYLADALGLSTEKIEKLYLTDISEAIEDVLSTPQKKKGV